MIACWDAISVLFCFLPHISFIPTFHPLLHRFLVHPENFSGVRSTQFQFQLLLPLSNPYQLLSCSHTYIPSPLVSSYSNLLSYSSFPQTGKKLNRKKQENPYFWKSLFRLWTNGMNWFKLLIHRKKRKSVRLPSIRPHLFRLLDLTQQAISSTDKRGTGPSLDPVKSGKSSSCLLSCDCPKKREKTSR